MSNYIKTELNGKKVKLNKSTYEQCSKYTSDELTILSNYYKMEDSNAKSTRKANVKEPILVMLGSLLGGAVLSIPAILMTISGFYNTAPMGYLLCCWLGIAPVAYGIKDGAEDIYYEMINPIRRKTFNKNKGIIENYIAEKEKDKKLCEQETKPVVKKEKIQVAKSQKDIKSLSLYRKHIIETGGKEELFDLPAVTQIIEDIIENGELRLKMEGKSPLYYKNANEDGTFDICGRMYGPSVTVVYKMEYCNTNNSEDYIVLKKYQKNIIEDDYYKASYKEIYINKEGNVIREEKNILLDEFDNRSLLTESNKVLKKI